MATELPGILGRAVALATAEALQAAALAAGIDCERLATAGGGAAGGVGLRLTNLHASGRCHPPLPPGLQASSDSPASPPVLTASEEGWQAFVPGLRAPAGVAAGWGFLCSGLGGVVRFDRRGGATLSYRAPASAWPLHDLLLDLQGVAMAHALLRRVAALQAADALAGARLAEASCAGLSLVVVAAGSASGGSAARSRHVRIEWHGGCSAANAPPGAPSEAPPQPALQVRLLVDGVPQPAVQQQALTLIAAGALGELVKLCELDRDTHS